MVKRKSVSLLFCHTTYLASFEMFCWIRIEFSLADTVKKLKRIYTVKEGRNIPHKMRRSKTNRLCYFLRRNWLLRHVFEGKIEGTRRRGLRSKQLLEDLKEKRRHWNLKEEELDCTKLCYFLST